MPAVDEFAGKGETPASPATRAEAVTPDDAAELTRVSRALWVGGAGNVAVLTIGGDTVTFVGVAAGSLIPIRARRVNSSSTTATSILALS